MSDELFPRNEKPADTIEAVKLVRRWLTVRRIRVGRVVAYTNGKGKVFVVIDGGKLNGSFEALVRATRPFGFDIVTHTQSFEVDK